MISMQNTNAVILAGEDIVLPRSPALYALFSDEQCLYVGLTSNLNDAVVKHRLFSEPSVPLRYFMQSARMKILLYEVFNYDTLTNRLMKKHMWTELFKPADFFQEPFYAAY